MSSNSSVGADDGDGIRWLVASDPKEARQRFHELLTAGGEPLQLFLSKASRPGDGRVRQMVATVYRTEPSAAALEAWLSQWLSVETDEFTRAALENALAARGDKPARPRAARGATEQMVAAYRFVSDRLSHRVRNAMALPNAQLRRLNDVVSQLPEGEQRSELERAIAAIQGGFVRIARNVDFRTDDHYLEWDSVPVVEWVSANERLFTERFGAAQLIMRGHQSIQRARVRATPFLLETLFGNLWANAVQASEPPYSFEIDAALNPSKRELYLVIADRGPGFSDTHLDEAFQQMFSTKGVTRGRGLLEIADAVTQLQGTVALARRMGGDYRVAITLPLDAV